MKHLRLAGEADPINAIATLSRNLKHCRFKIIFFEYSLPSSILYSALHSSTVAFPAVPDARVSLA
jgi:hypothetical protein